MLQPSVENRNENEDDKDLLYATAGTEHGFDEPRIE